MPFDYTPESRDIASEFNRSRYGGRGIQNVATEVGAAKPKRISPQTEQGEIRRIRGRRWQDNAPSGFFGAPKRLIGRKLEQVGKYQKVKDRAAITGHGQDAIAIIASKINISFAIGWTGLVVFFILAPFSILSIMGLAAAAVVESSAMLSWVYNAAGYLVATIMGWPQVDMWMIGISFWIIQIGLVLLMFFGAFIQMSAGKIKSLNGNNGGNKKTLFLLSLLFSFFPATGFVPFIHVWLFYVHKHPK